MDRLEKAREHLQLSARTGANEQEHRELRAAVSELLEEVKHLRHQRVSLKLED